MLISSRHPRRVWYVHFGKSNPTITNGTFNSPTVSGTRSSPAAQTPIAPVLMQVVVAKICISNAHTPASGSSVSTIAVPEKPSAVAPFKLACRPFNSVSHTHSAHSRSSFTFWRGPRAGGPVPVVTGPSDSAVEWVAVSGPAVVAQSAPVEALPLDGISGPVDALLSGGGWAPVDTGTVPRSAHIASAQCGTRRPASLANFLTTSATCAGPGPTSDIICTILGWTNC
mmetsp:Transcript_4499/g.10509  ORF Transcript_4499/g.10509 Transcript_4499/m.10509 type:complete len:227 (+) Transcript_4499:767-1447(+)